VLVATSESNVGSAGARTSLVFERAIRGTLVERRGLTFDTKYAAAASGKPEPVGHLFALIEGSLQLDDGTLCKPPFAFMLADDEWERRGKSSRTFRSWGAKFDVVQLRFSRDQLRVPIGIAHGAVALTPACWDAARALLARGPTGDATVLSAMLEALASAGVIATTVPRTVIEQEPERFRRLWDALRPLYQTHGATTSLKQLASSLGMSMRQVGRDAKELSTAFGIGGGYRDALLVLRLRTAVLMLSAPDAGVAEVAKLVGYGSPIAMARAFRDADLPAPSVIQADVRGASPSPQ
jgi:AraC-like DNA-binding protein